MSNETYEDRELQCQECEQSWVWTAGEQQFFAEKEFKEPKRCKACRKARREQREDPAP